MIVKSVYMFDKYNYVELKQYFNTPKLYSMTSALQVHDQCMIRAWPGGGGSHTIYGKP